MLRSCSIYLATAIMAGLPLSGLALGAEKPHPRIHRALYELREARAELKGAAHDFGGHRKAALKDVDVAITQLEKALKFSGDTRPFKGDSKAEVYRKYKSYPHIRQSIVELRETVSELKAASRTYGGHRKQAVEATEAAVRQLQLCVKFANSRK
jgi:hypothetical protein